MIKIGVIGYGYWGPNLVRNFVETSGCQVLMVSDLKADHRQRVQSRYPHLTVTTDGYDLIKSPDLDAIAIATPVSTHFPLALAALQHGKHVLIEKPMATTPQQCEQLIDEAQKRGLILLVDHTFVYTGAVRKMAQLISDGSLGEIYYYDSTRVNLGLFQHDVNVVWDLAVHDLSIIEFLFTEKPRAVSATGISHVSGRPENVAYMTLYFDSTFIAHINVNWLAPVKIRQTLIGGSRKMIVYDELEPTEKIKVYDRGITLNETSKDEDIYHLLVGYRTGDMWSPQLDGVEALRRQATHFMECIKNGTQPITDGPAGLRVVKVLEAATRSIQQQGRLVELE